VQNPMKPQRSQPENQQTPGRPGHGTNLALLPGWGKVVIGMVALLALAGYLSPDMRAVYVAAWAACF
jgi:hypothetical protein